MSSPVARCLCHVLECLASWCKSPPQLSTTSGPKVLRLWPRWPASDRLCNILAPFFSLQLINLSIYLSIYLSVYLSIHPSTVSIYLSIHRSIYPSIYPSIHLYDFFGSPRYRQQDIARHHFGCFIQLFHGRRDLGVEGGVDFHLRLRNISER